MTATTDTLRFATRFWEALTQDLPEAPRQPRQVAQACASAVDPEPMPAPELLAWSADCAAQLGLADPADAPEREAAALLWAGQRGAPGGQCYALRYGGHQFGNWAGQLGDGRVINLGELRDAQGVWQTLQLKGAGRTPYSRGADGRAVLRSSIREFVLSEAMAALGVPTSRALALVGSGEQVERDMFYDGRPRLEPGAIVTRVAPSFVRLGNFEIHAALEETDTLRRLCDYVMAEHYPEQGGDVVGFYAEVCRRTARLLADWMSLGFVHGVMNTDNLSILGLTIDYGPFGWLEPLEPDWTPNTTDAQQRRYCYARQPQIAQWNLGCLGAALMPLGPPRAELEQALRAFHAEYNAAFRARMAAKLGLEAIGAEDEDWLQQLFALMQARALDFSRTFRALSGPLAQAQGEALLAALDAHSYAESDWTPQQRALAEQWFAGWHARRRVAPEALRAHNPAVVPRNWLLAEAIEAAEAGDMSVLERLQAALARPFEDPADAHLAGLRPDWARDKAGCSQLSCSS